MIFWENQASRDPTPVNKVNKGRDTLCSTEFIGSRVDRNRNDARMVHRMSTELSDELLKVTPNEVG
jgi:hypothetical protein